MLFAQCLDQIQAARSGEILDMLSRALWSQESPLSDDQAQHLAEAIHARRQSLKPSSKGQGSRISFPRPKAQRARDRKLSLMRRRQLAASGPMPPAMAAHFTTAELAALKIVADEVRAGGLCALVLDAIAARAGVSKRTVQNALKEAEALGYLTIRRRRLPGQLKNLPNLVTIAALEWLAWLKVAKPSSPRITDRYRNQDASNSKGLAHPSRWLRRAHQGLRREWIQGEIRPLRPDGHRHGLREVP